MSTTENTITTKQNISEEIKSLEKQKENALQHGQTSLAKLYESDIMILKKKLKKRSKPPDKLTNLDRLRELTKKLVHV